MAVQVKCADCGHADQLQAPSDVWKCSECGELNEAFGTEDNSNDPAEQEAAHLQARLLELRGGIGPKGETNG